MTTLFDANLIVLIVALLIGVAVGWWMFRRSATRRVGTDRQDKVAAPPAATPIPPHRRDTPEGNSLLDEGAAATTDVAGHVLGVQVHGELPGASGPPDNLQTLKGVGPKLAQRLNQLGITRFEQLARLSANEVDILDSQLGPFKGRIARDRLVEQSAYLARGDTDGFQAKFGNLGTGTLQ